MLDRADDVVVLRARRPTGPPLRRNVAITLLGLADGFCQDVADVLVGLDAVSSGHTINHLDRVTILPVLAAASRALVLLVRHLLLRQQVLLLLHEAILQHLLKLKLDVFRETVLGLHIRSIGCSK